MTRFTRTPDIAETDVGDDLFLVHPESEEIVHLDALAAAIWRALATPQDVETLLELFAAAFPEQPRTGLAEDLNAGLESLRAADLIRPDDRA